MENKNTAFLKKKIILLAAAICCIAILASGTLAYFTAEETARNVITTGVVAMELRELTAEGKPFPAGGISGVMPGQAVDKIVTIANTGNADFYARIALEKTVKNASGSALSFDGIALDINTADWTEKDGYYYYNHAVEPGGETKPLFTKVSFANRLGNEYMNSRVEITVDAQVVQSKNNAQSALEAAGWTSAD